MSYVYPVCWEKMNPNFEESFSHKWLNLFNHLNSVAQTCIIPISFACKLRGRNHAGTKIPAFPLIFSVIPKGNDTEICWSSGIWEIGTKSNYECFSPEVSMVVLPYVPYVQSLIRPPKAWNSKRQLFFHKARWCGLNFTNSNLYPMTKSVQLKWIVLLNR